MMSEELPATPAKYPPHECVGMRTVLDVYDDNRRTVEILSHEFGRDPRGKVQKIKATVSTAKVHCHLCAQTFLEEIPVPHKP